MGSAISMIDHLKETFRNQFAKKTDVETLEKSIDGLSKFVYEDEQKRKIEKERQLEMFDDRIKEMQKLSMKLEKDFFSLSEKRVKNIENRLMDKVEYNDF